MGTCFKSSTQQFQLSSFTKNYITMDAIKKKMQAMKLEKDNAMDRADACEQQAKDANLRAERAKEEVEALEKKMVQLENELVSTTTNLMNANQRLEEKEKALQNAEGEVAALNRRIQLLEEDLERSEERLATATQKLAEASHAADESERIRKALENKNNMEDDRVAILEAQLAQAKLIAEEGAETGESKIVELEEELRVVGNNLKSLEVSEEKANQREESYKEQIKTLTTKHKEAEARAEFAERSVTKLQKEVDRLEDELVHEKEKFKAISDELDQTFAEMSGY